MPRKLSLALVLAIVLLGAETEAPSPDQATARTRATLTAFPTRAKPGAKVRVRGRGFPARRRVALFLGRKRVRTLRANRRGGFRVRFRVPKSRPRLYRLVARARGLVVRLRFRLLRAPSPPQSSDPSPSTSAPTPPPGAPTAAKPAAPPVRTLVAAGDIACAPPATPTSTTCRQGVTSDRVLALGPNAVALLGDNQYEKGELSNFQTVFDPSWGRFKSLTHPGIGNHEYLDDPQHDSADGYFSYFGAAAGDSAKGYYSYSLGSWRLFALNTGDLGYGVADCFPVSCLAGSAQEQWLRGQLASLPASTCVLAYWHHPRYASDTPRAHSEVSALYDALFDYGAELALTGHSHTYERFAPMDASGSANAKGVREFVVGTGGRSHFNVTQSIANSEKLDTANFGVLELKLAGTSYGFRFVSEGGSVIDQGSGSCHGRP
jgi:acid phosphatase type 7